MSHSVRVTEGETWKMHVYLTEDDAPVELSTPAAMDIRSSAGVLVARLDSDPDEDEGSITVDGLSTAGLLLELDTTGLATGSHQFDLWCELDSDPGVPYLVLDGTFLITSRQTDPRS